MPNLDRFSQGLPDPQDKPLDMVGVCGCGCRERIYFGDKGVWRDDGVYYVNGDHYAKASGAEGMDVEWS
ncbi:hypothetical protein [Cohnella sp. AR92]|uniref:hypothetical protein n=1 Tax=Cohnella sp. AR92 TaxID=648716 RepID=UPI000F8F1E1E|nr:hypothetical protein [Cohnella sp. AR92]RUS42053.1 hypothetical protein ELR57_27440 [Cohnella sp. AR92]RUS42250.1 hypothetical protein ELR57_26925 [Cohnella sp. AR92]